MATFPEFSLATLQIATGITVAIHVAEDLYLLDAFREEPEWNLFRNSLEDKRSTTMMDLFANWHTSFEALTAIAKAINSHKVTVQPLVRDTYDVLTPIRFPKKLLAVGANYKGHLVEMGVPVQRIDPMPYFFRPPTTSLVGPGCTVRKPCTTEQFDWELELVLVLGKGLRHAHSLKEADDAIAGYTVGLDLSCRDLQMVKDLGMDVGRGKAQDTLAPCGPFFVPKHNLPRGTNSLSLKLWVNEQQMIESSTSDMLVSPAEIVMEMSKYTTLEPGDMVFTGAPTGTAKAHGNRWLQVGDHIRASIERVGMLHVEIMADMKVTMEELSVAAQSG